MMRLKNILVPIDFSKEAELAVEWAVMLGKEEPEATLFLLHVLFPMPTVESGMALGMLGEAAQEQAREQLEKWRRKIPPALSTVAFVKWGDPVEQIGAICAENDIDLVVMTTRGRQGVTRMVHPNLTEKVVRIAPCPVLALHLNQKLPSLAK